MRELGARIAKKSSRFFTNVAPIRCGVGASLYLKKFSDLKELGPEFLKVGVKRIESLPGLAAGARSILA